MKKLLAVLAVVAIGSGGLGVTLTQTGAEVQIAINNARGVCLVGHNGTDYTNAVTTSFTNIVPQAGGEFSETYTASSDFSVTTNGIFTCNFGGTIIGLADGSFSLVSAGSAIISGDWFVDGVNSMRGFKRDANNATFGSFAGSLGGHLVVTNGTTLDFRVNSDASDSVDFHNIQLKLERIQ